MEILVKNLIKIKFLIKNLFLHIKTKRYNRINRVKSYVGSVAINLQPIPSAYGGGNQWANLITRFLISQGYRVFFDLKNNVDIIIIVDPRLSGLIKFGIEEIKAYKRKYPKVRCIHRINECDKRKCTYEMDNLLQEANTIADFTVFISEWLFKYHAEKWFDKEKPHSIIYNGSDPSIFHPIGGSIYSSEKSLRLVTHHWSDNWNKGFKFYHELDRLIYNGELPNTEFWVIGRWPKDLKWKAAKTFPPTYGISLSKLLRKCHIYITASLWEPGGMHHVEAAQCGLPIIFHEDGGGIVEVASKYGISFKEDIKGAILKAKEYYPILRERVLKYSPSGVQMCLDYLRIIQRLLAGEIVDYTC